MCQGLLLEPPFAADRSPQKAFTAHVLLIAALYLSKLSIILFCRKVFSGDLRHERTVFAICYSVVTITGVASLLDVAAGCRPANFLLGDGDRVCSNNVRRFVAHNATLYADRFRTDHAGRAALRP
jgi:hypothetical protein